MPTSNALWFKKVLLGPVQVSFSILLLSDDLDATQRIIIPNQYRKTTIGKMFYWPLSLLKGPVPPRTNYKDIYAVTGFHYKKLKCLI